MALHHYESVHLRVRRASRPRQRRTQTEPARHGRFMDDCSRTWSRRVPSIKLISMWTGMHRLTPASQRCPFRPICVKRTERSLPTQERSALCRSPYLWFNLGTWLIYDPGTDASGDGAFVVNRGTSCSEFYGGLSNTLAIAEVKTYQPYIRNTRTPSAQTPVAGGRVRRLVG